MSLEDLILKRLLDLKIGHPASSQPFQRVIAEIVGKNGIPASLKLIKDANLDYQDKENARQHLTVIQRQSIYLHESKRSIPSKDIVGKLNEFQTSLNEFNDAIRDIDSSWFCGGGAKKKSFTEAANKLAAFQHMFQVLRYASSLEVDKYNQTVQRIVQETRQDLQQFRADPSQPGSGRQRGREQRQQGLEELFRSLSLQPNPYRVKQILPQTAQNEWIYGRLYQEGKIFNCDLMKAKQYYQKAVSKGQAEGQYRLGCILEKDYRESKFLQDHQYIHLWQQAAAQGHLEAICDLGYLYEQGYGKRGPNLEKAVKYYLMACKQNHPRAMNNLASLYMTNTSLRKQQEHPIDLLERAVDLGYSRAYLNLAICYQKGKMVEANRGKSLTLLKQGADKGDLECRLFWVFNLIQDNQVEEEDWLEAHHFCLQVISETENRPEGYYFLGYMYEMGLGCVKEEETSFLYYMKAAKLQYPAAINKIGDFYHSGFGVQKNLSLAFKSYQLAAEQNYPEALINLAFIYQEGYEGVAITDPRRAVELYQKASDLGSSQAMLILCDLYETGRHVRKSKQRAQQYLQRAAKLGNKVALETLQQRNR